MIPLKKLILSAFMMFMGSQICHGSALIEDYKEEEERWVSSSPIMWLTSTVGKSNALELSEFLDFTSKALNDQKKSLEGLSAMTFASRAGNLSDVERAQKNAGFQQRLQHVDIIASNTSFKDLTPLSMEKGFVLKTQTGSTPGILTEVTLCPMTTDLLGGVDHKLDSLNLLSSESASIAYKSILSALCQIISYHMSIEGHQMGFSLLTSYFDSVHKICEDKEVMEAEDLKNLRNGVLLSIQKRLLDVRKFAVMATSGLRNDEERSSLNISAQTILAATSNFLRHVTIGEVNLFDHKEPTLLYMKSAPGSKGVHDKESTAFCPLSLSTLGTEDLKLDAISLETLSDACAAQPPLHEAMNQLSAYMAL